MAGRPFKDFVEISPATQSVLAAYNFTNATPVQEATIPLFCGNKDVAVDACTGSGKTLAFIIPVLEKMRRLEAPLKRFQVGAVVISPTRELSRQIYEVATPFFDSLPWLTSKLLVGGSDPVADVADLKESGSHVLVGTPGRLDDVLQRCTFLDLKSVEVLVLDEADRLLDMGFKAQIDAIIKRLPKQRRTGLFSATQTEAVIALARAGLRNPVRINVAVTYAQDTGAERGGKKENAKRKQRDLEGLDGDGNEEERSKVQKKGDVAQVTPTSLSVQYTLCSIREKLAELVAFLKAHSSEKVIVYFLTCACVDYFNSILPLLTSKEKDNQGGVQFLPLHGKMKQAARETTLTAFAEKKAGVLLATDVAARGLDIPDVHWVVQYDAPQDPSAFVHRCGRTARMGRSGQALVYLTTEESAYVDFLSVRKVPLTEAEGLLVSEDVTQVGGGKKEIEVERVIERVRKVSEGDRAVMELGTKAFVSYIRAYKEHHCKYIFQLDDLSLGDLASCFALLRLPGMPEVKKAMRKKEGITGFIPSSLDIDSIKFKDKAREKQRQALLKQNQEKSGIEKKERQHKKKEVAKEQLTQQQRLTAAKRRKLEAKQEFDELNDEYALLRKLKKGKISQKDYDVATGLSSDSDMEMDNKQQQQQSKKKAGIEPNTTTAATTTVTSKEVDGGMNGVKKGGAVGGGKVVLPSVNKDYVGEALKKKAKKKKKKRRQQATVDE